jgi:hypothetical protein
MFDDKFDLGNIILNGSGNGHHADDMPYYRASNSSIKAYHYPYCCTGAILADLGGSNDSYGATPERRNVKAQIEAWVVAIENDCLSQSKEFISVSTTEEQGAVNCALKELGFIPTKSMTNDINDYPLILWTLALSGYEEE